MNIIEAVQREIDARGYKGVQIMRQAFGNKAGVGLASPEKLVAVGFRELEPGETLDDRTESNVKFAVYSLFEQWEPRETLVSSATGTQARRA